MSRRDMQVDGMLRHLGAAYYDTLHGRAGPADVARALDRVAEKMGEQPEDGTSLPSDGKQHPAVRKHGRWHTRVGDIMTISVVTVDRITPYKEIVSLLAEHEISGMPVLALGRQVVGVVSESDLITAQDKRRGRRSGWAGRLHLAGGHGQEAHTGLTAGELMTAPAIIVHPGASVPATARLMHAHNIRRLPVVDDTGKLVGVVSRRDLISVFLRPDVEIAAQVGELLDEILPAVPGEIKVTVRNGVVVMTGQAGPVDQPDLIPIAERLAWDIEGVVDVVNKIQPSTQKTA
jgi:CBS domain-containing protein